MKKSAEWDPVLSGLEDLEELGSAYGCISVKLFSESPSDSANLKFYVNEENHLPVGCLNMAFRAIGS